MPDPTSTMTAADEARAWIQRLVRFADECNIQNEAEPIPEENCPPTHCNALVRLKPLPDGRVSMYEPGVEVTPDRLQAFLAEHDGQRDRAEKAEAELAELRAQAVEAEQQARERAAAELAQIPIVQRLGIVGCDSFVKQVADSTLRYAAMVVLKGGGDA